MSFGGGGKNGSFLSNLGVKIADRMGHSNWGLRGEFMTSSNFNSDGLVIVKWFYQTKCIRWQLPINSNIKSIEKNFGITLLCTSYDTSKIQSSRLLIAILSASLPSLVIAFISFSIYALIPQNGKACSCS